MKNRYKILSALILALINFFYAPAQSLKRESINAMGSTGYGDGYYLKQTIGQSSNTELFTGDKLTLRQGFEQPVAAAYAKNGCPVCNILLYPNPLKSESVLQIPPVTEEYSLIIADVLGKVVLLKDHLLLESQVLSARDLPAGQYVLKITYANGCFCSSKLIVMP